MGIKMDLHRLDLLRKSRRRPNRLKGNIPDSLRNRLDGSVLKIHENGTRLGYMRSALCLTLHTSSHMWVALWIGSL